MLFRSRAWYSFLLREKKRRATREIQKYLDFSDIIIDYNINNSLTLSNAVVNNKVVTASFKDQYGDDFAYTEGGLKVTCLSVPSGLKTSDVQDNNDYYTVTSLQGNKQKVTFKYKGVYMDEIMPPCADIQSVIRILKSYLMRE